MERIHQQLKGITLEYAQYISFHQDIGNKFCDENAQRK
jgi:hypothetical protein